MPITILRAPENSVTQIKNLKLDGYQAIQLGVGKKKKKVEVKTNDLESISLGQTIKVEDVFAQGQLVLSRGISKGRGFTGVVKRWGFATQPKTHGQSDRERAPGSIGAQTPGRVLKGKKMPGHFGANRVTVKNLLVVKVDAKKQEIWLKGAVSGYNKSWNLITKTGKSVKDFVQLKDKVKNEQKNGTKK